MHGKDLGNRGGAWSLCWTPNKGKGAGSDSDVYLWTPFPLTELPCLSSIEEDEPSPTTAYYARARWVDIHGRPPLLRGEKEGDGKKGGKVNRGAL